MPYGLIGNKQASFTSGKANGVFSLGDVCALQKGSAWHQPNLAKRLAIPAPSPAPSAQLGLVPVPHPNGRLVVLVGAIESYATAQSSPVLAYSLNGAAPITVASAAFDGTNYIRSSIYNYGLSPDGIHFYVHFMNYAAGGDCLVYDCDGFSLSNPRSAFSSGTPRTQGRGYLNGGLWAVPRMNWSSDGQYIYGFGTDSRRSQFSTRNPATGILTPQTLSWGAGSEESFYGGGDWYGNGNQFNMLLSPNKRGVFTWGNKGSANYCVMAVGGVNLDARTGTARTATPGISGASDRQIFNPQWSFDGQYVFVDEGSRSDGDRKLYHYRTNGLGTWAGTSGNSASFVAIDPTVTFTAFACTDTEIIACTKAGQIVAYKYSDDSFTKRVLIDLQQPTISGPVGFMHSSVATPKLLGLGRASPNAWTSNALILRATENAANV